ncbi:MAG TPA: hypothetical protein VGK10_14835 [Prolixibacteraceae bacterium]|jgi:beta-glucanase (GH16 family)
MSFKLFLASTFGLIKPTVKIESAHDALLADYRVFCDFEKSKELKEYQELELLVNSTAFKQNKKNLQNLGLKGSQEAAQLAEFKKLERNGRLRKFYTTSKSEELKRFDRIAGSDLMKKYKELKSAVEKHSLEALKKMDKNSKEHVTYMEFEALKESADLTFFRNYRKSAVYKNYELMLDSPEHKRFEELQKIINSPEFKARVAYLEDKKKWEKTDDAKKEKQLAEMQNSPQLVNYLKYKNSTAFDFFKKWELVFEDRFDGGKLDTQKWMTQSHWASQTLGQNFSQVGDLHAFTDGKNISLNGHSLRLEVRQEKQTGMQWRIPFGFVEQQFDYTSGIVSTAGAEWWKHGILEAKVKYDPAKNLVDAIYLLGEETSPQINLVEMGEMNRVGLFTRKADGYQAESENLSGLKSGQFYIFRLEWSANSLVWKINDREVLSITHNVPAFKMHLNAASIVVNDPSGSLPHKFEIDWVRFYQHHKG